MNKRASIRVSYALFCIGLVMVAAAFTFALHNIKEAKHAETAARTAVQQLHAIMDQTSGAFSTPVEADMEADAAIPEGQPEELSDSFTEAIEQTEAESVSLNGYRYLGILSIPTLNLELPVMETCTESNLKLSPCLYSGAADTADMVIAGHSYKRHFGPLKTLSIGDQIVFTSVSGRERIYSVDSVEVLNPWQIHEMTSGEWDLTLFTCTPSGQARLAIRCAASGD